MAYEAIQQAILQRPQLVLAGLGQAADRAREEKLMEIARSQNIANALLQAIGVAVDQQRYGEQMDFAREGRAFEQGMEEKRYGLQERGMGLQEQAAGREAEAFGWQREDRPLQRESAQLGVDQQRLGLERGRAEFDESQALRALRERAAELGIEGQEINNALGVLERNFGQATFGSRVAGAGLDVEAKRQGIEAGKQEMEARKARADWEARFRAAKTDAERFQIAGENPQAWLDMALTGMRLDAAGQEAAIKAGTPQQHALDELAKLRDKFRMTQVTKATPMGGLLGDDAAEAAGKEVGLIDAAIQAINAGQFAPVEGETKEAFLGRVLTTLLGGGAAPAAGGAATAQADDPFGIGG